ncbi:hypothetical protein RHO12_08765 [Orbus sturtevantii]|uniref:hypothetical protein n=1 Tax=Orbus sturtevantii TaxID=3074109 RepID=UPI00370DAE55
MKKISIRTRITLWYTFMLMIFLAIGVAGSYNAMYDILLEQHRVGMQKGANNLARLITRADNSAQLAVLEKKCYQKISTLSFLTTRTKSRPANMKLG